MSTPAIFSASALFSLAWLSFNAIWDAVLSDLDMDVNFYRQQVEKDVAVWKSKDNIKKRVQDGVITKEELERSILDLNNEYKAKVKTAVDVQDDLYNQKIIGLQRDYEPVLSDLDMDVNFYRQQVEKDVADELNREFAGMTGIPQSTIQTNDFRYVKEHFRYALRGIAEQNLAVWKSKDNIKKRVQDIVTGKQIGRAHV